MIWYMYPLWNDYHNQAINAFITSLSYLIYSFTFWLYCIACGILVPQPGSQPTPHALEAQSLIHWPAKDYPTYHFLCVCWEHYCPTTGYSIINYNYHCTLDPQNLLI